MSDDQQPLLPVSEENKAVEPVGQLEPVEVQDENADEEHSAAARLDLSDDENEARIESTLTQLEDNMVSIENRIAAKSAELPAQVEKKMIDARVRMVEKIDGMVHRLVNRVESRVGLAEKEIERVMEKMVDDMVNQMTGELDRQIGAFDTTIDDTIQKTEKTIDELEAQITKCCQIM